MNIIRLMVLAVCGLPLAAPIAGALAAQGVAPGARVGRTTANAPRLMVATPFVTSSADAPAAVEIGSVTRESVQELVGDDYNVVTRDQMNQALTEFGFDPDEILDSRGVIELAKSISAQTVITSTLARAQDGNYAMTVRLVGRTDPAGYVRVVSQRPDERPLEFGYRIADSMRPAIKALADAKACMDRQETKPDKALKAAEKAIKRAPNHGLANYCLFQMAERQKAPRQESVKYLEAAVKGDPFSLVAWDRLAIIYDEAKDTANALRAAKELLRLAPTNQVLRERIFLFFQRSGQPKLALEVADEGLKLDSNNSELYDLRANACIALEDYDCARDALERVFAMDSTKADSMFFRKINYVVADAGATDTAGLLRWAELGARKYPNDQVLLNYLVRAYAMTGQNDSTIAVTRRIMERDTTTVKPALAAAQLLVKEGQTTELAPFIDYVKRYGDATEKTQLAGVLAAPASRALQGDTATKTPSDLPRAVELSRLIVELADTSSSEGQVGLYILGTALLQQAVEVDSTAEKEQSCDLAKQEQQLMADSKAALERITAPKFKDLAARNIGFIGDYSPRVNSMLKKFCR